MRIERSIQLWMATVTRICSPSFETCFQKRKSHEQHLRTALDFLIGHYFLLRGDNRRKLELADLNVVDFPDEAHQPCKAWVAIFDNGKTNSTGKKQNRGHA
jgi:hypothetical protein